MKKVFSLLITLAMLISTVAVPMSASAATTAWDGTTLDTEWAGSGTEADPYQISSAEELAGLASKVYNSVNHTTGEKDSTIKMTERTIQNESVTVYSVYDGVYFELTADIDLGNKEWTPIGRYGARFNGKFNGNGHVIKNVSITKLYVGVGLFGVTGPSVLIENLGIDGFTGNVPSANYGVNKMDEFIKFGNPTGNTTTYLWGSGSMVGIYSGGTFKNSYVRNADYTTSANTGEAGFGGFAGNDVVTSFCPNVYFTNCYVVNVKAKVKDQASGFIARMGEIGNSGDALGYYENCYVGGTIDLESTRGDSYEYGFGYRASREPQKLSNCFTNTLLCTSNSILSVESTQAQIVEGISTASGFVADNAKALINDGYPVLSWQADWVWDGASLDTEWAGTGTETDPYLISNGAELAGLANKIYTSVNNGTKTITAGMENDVALSWDTNGSNDTKNMYNVYTGKYFKLTSDIDLGNKEWTPIGRAGARFDGNFDGDGHIVKNVKITTTYAGIGFFGATGSSAKVEKLGLENVTIAFNEGNDAADYTAFGGRYQWGTGFGAMVGIVNGTFENCYVKDVDLKNTNTGSSENGIGGFAGRTNNIDQHATARFTNCYVMNVKITAKNAAAGFMSTSYDGNLYTKTKRYFTNCYVGGTIELLPNSTTELAKTGFVRTTRVADWALSEQCTAVNCYSEGDTYVAADPLQSQSTKADIVAGLANVDGWYADHETSPINGGYPILDWQNTWKKPYEVKAVTIADGKVTDVTLKQNEAITGVVIVAVYAGDRFVGAVTADAAAGLVDITDIPAATGNTVKVFVWDSLSALSPVAYEYATTVE